MLTSSRQLVRRTVVSGSIRFRETTSVGVVTLACAEGTCAGAPMVGVDRKWAWWREPHFLNVFCLFRWGREKICVLGMEVLDEAAFCEFLKDYAYV
jgi:hypothetical protein